MVKILLNGKKKLSGDTAESPNDTASVVNVKERQHHLDICPVMANAVKPSMTS